jgi:hypothetical protein
VGKEVVSRIRSGMTLLMVRMVVIGGLVTGNRTRRVKARKAKERGRDLVFAVVVLDMR